MLLHSTVIIEKEKIDKKKGVINPDAKSQVGIVKEIGLLIPQTEDGQGIKIGDRVVYYENSLTEIEFDGKKEFVLEYDDIIKTIDPLTTDLLD
jgi:co-chaperonin GroES (HSP10)